MDYNESFKLQLRYFRNKNGFTQTTLSKKMNYSPSAIANYESGRNQPSFSDLQRLCQFLHTTPNQLFGVVEAEITEDDFLFMLKMMEHSQKISNINIAQCCDEIENLIANLIRLHYELQKDMPKPSK